MIARPKISRNEWKTAEIGAFEVGNVALFSCPALDLRGRVVAVVGDVRGDAPERGLGPVVVVVRVRGVLVSERAQVRDLRANQPVSRDVGAKLENALARSSRFG